jgi:translation initiation factor 3 subunit L
VLLACFSFSKKTGQLRKLPTSDQLFKNYDRMIALLAICTHLCPQVIVEESIVKVIREKHGTQLSKDTYTDLFVYCSPKFVTASLPDFTSIVPTENAYKTQITVLEQDLECHSAFRKLRSYLKLYTSIPVSKLASFGNDELLSLSLKLNMRQLESTDVPSLTTASYKSALDIHYYLDADNVHVDEAEKQRRFENYFMAQIAQNIDIRTDVLAISTAM